MRIDDLRRDWSREIDESQVPTTRPETPQARRGDAAAELPPRDGRASEDLLAFVANFTTTSRQGIGASVLDAATATRGAVVTGQKLDAVRDAFGGPYTVSEGGRTETVQAPAMFRMNGGSNQAPAQDPANVRQLQKIAKEVGLPEGALGRALVGRATPDELRRLTQGMIDRGMLPEGKDLPSRIRTMQWQFGLGVDCAGYTYRAICEATGKTPKALGLAENAGNEAFRGLDNNSRFEKIGTKDQPRPRDVRAGDIITLDPGPGEHVGHNVIVRSNRDVSDTEKRALVARHGDAMRRFLEGAGPVVAIEVDSSWGAGREGNEWGGVRRDTWFYDTTFKTWASFDPTTQPPRLVVSAEGPAGDRYHGAYRAKVTP